jgi:hypothetical protein
MKFFFYIIIILCLYSLYSNYQKIIDYNEGRFVYAKIIKKPFSCEEINTRTTFIKVLCFDKIFVKKIGNGFCKDIEKDSLKMIISKNRKAIFFLNEKNSFNSNIISIILIILILVYCIYKIK